MCSGKCAVAVFCVQNSDLNVFIEYVTNNLVHFTDGIKLKNKCKYLLIY